MHESRSLTAMTFDVVSEGLTELRRIVAVSIWVSSFVVAAVLIVSALLLPCIAPSALTFTYLALIAFLTLSPLEWSDFRFTKRFIEWTTRDAVAYFSLRVKLRDASALDPDQAYLIGFEPHSILPLALPIVFTDRSPVLPSQLKGVHGVASFICFQIPLVRHLFWWLGIRPVSRRSITQILKSGQSVALVPGGVKEIQCMAPKKEVLFLKNRFGFVKLAIQSGSPLLPVFAFGQSNTYHAATFGVPKSILDALGRRLGAQPLWLSGRFGTTIPKRAPILVAIGTPIPVPHDPQPEPETIQSILTQFIQQMEEIYELYKNEAGMQDIQLCIM